MALLKFWRHLVASLLCLSCLLVGTGSTFAATQSNTANDGYFGPFSDGCSYFYQAGIGMYTERVCPHFQGVYDTYSAQNGQWIFYANVYFFQDGSVLFHTVNKEWVGYYPDGHFLILLADQSAVYIYPDGSVFVQRANGAFSVLDSAGQLVAQGATPNTLSPSSIAIGGGTINITATGNYVSPTVVTVGGVPMVVGVNDATGGNLPLANPSDLAAREFLLNMYQQLGKPGLTLLRPPVPVLSMGVNLRAFGRENWRVWPRFSDQGHALAFFTALLALRCDPASARSSGRWWTATGACSARYRRHQKSAC